MPTHTVAGPGHNILPPGTASPDCQHPRTPLGTPLGRRMKNDPIVTGQVGLRPLWVMMALVNDDLRQCLFCDPPAGMGPFHLTFTHHLPPGKLCCLEKQRRAELVGTLGLREAQLHVAAASNLHTTACRHDRPSCRPAPAIHRRLHAPSSPAAQVHTVVLAGLDKTGLQTGQPQPPMTMSL